LLFIGTPLLMFAGAVGHIAAVRISIRIRPGASCTMVGGEHDGALVVRVAAPAVAGHATEAALADAFDVRRSAVTPCWHDQQNKVVHIIGGERAVFDDLLTH
jgi:uncharacterized protein YggU (UPF0235/DUF167 family)